MSASEAMGEEDRAQHAKAHKRPKWMLSPWNPMRLLFCCFPCYGCMSPNTAYTLMRDLAQFVLGCFYSRIEIVNPWNVPEDGPCIFVVNHTNALVDVALVLASTYRKVCMMAKAPLFKAPLIGAILKKTGNIPVFRKADNKGEKADNGGMFAK
jgi:1-acyl-sn-glycerol-3-phosphate acyltransferase